MGRKRERPNTSKDFVWVLFYPVLCNFTKFPLPFFFLKQSSSSLLYCTCSNKNHGPKRYMNKN